MQKGVLSRFFGWLTHRAMASVVGLLVVVGLWQGLPSYAQIPGDELAVNLRDMETAAVDPCVADRADHEDPADYVWDRSEVIPILLQGTAIVAGDSGARVDGSKVTITRGGTYRLSGTLTDGQIIVGSQDKGTVRLGLQGTEICCSWGAAVFTEQAKKTGIFLAENTENYLADGRFD